MKGNHQGRVMTVGSLVLVALLISACDQTGADPFQAGQLFRQQVDIALEEAGRFIAGFCSSAALPGLLVMAVAWLTATRRGM